VGPVVTALLFAGRAGPHWRPSWADARHRIQLSAMEMMAVDPIKRVVVPRFLAGLLYALLAAIFS